MPRPSQWKLLVKAAPPWVKPLLYVYRVLLTGIHLMRTGEVEANLCRLNEIFRLPFIDDLVAQKVSGREQQTLNQADLVFHDTQRQRLELDLRQASEQSPLPEKATRKDALSDLLVRLRLG